MRILICDDDTSMITLIRQSIESYFKEHEIDVRIVCVSSAEEVLKMDKKFDLAFLDIEMGNMNGLQLGYRLKEKNPAIILFIITCYENYLDDAFDLQVFRFLKKPLDTKRLYKGLDSVLSRTHRCIFRASGQCISLDSNSIVCIYIDKRKTHIITTTEQFESTENLTYWKEQVGSTLFAQPHYSYLVNMNYVIRLENDFIVLRYGKNIINIPCSQRKRKEFKEVFFEFTRQRR